MNLYEGYQTMPLSGTTPDHPTQKMVPYTRDTGSRETIKRLVPVHKSLTCSIEGCGGEMRNTGEVLMSNPPWYVHRCAKCGFKENILGVSYPCIDYIYEDME